MDYYLRKRTDLKAAYMDNLVFPCEPSKGTRIYYEKNGDFVCENFIEYSATDSVTENQRCEPEREAPVLTLPVTKPIDNENPTMIDVAERPITQKRNEDASTEGDPYLNPVEPLLEEFGYSPEDGRLYKYHYQWIDDADSVFLTGDFLDWSNTIRLQKIDGVFALTVYLPTPKTTIRFIVDGEWKVSDSYWISYDKFKIRNNDVYGEYIDNLDSDFSDYESMVEISSVASQFELERIGDTEREPLYYSVIEPVPEKFGLSFDENRLYEYTITWISPAERVLITGDFLDWKEFMHLHYNDTTCEHSITIFLSKSKVTIRYLVDGVWNYSDNNWVSFDKFENKCNDIYGDFAGYIQESENETEEHLEVESESYKITPAEVFLDAIDYTEEAFGYSAARGRIYEYFLKFPHPAESVIATGDFLDWLKGVKLHNSDQGHTIKLYLGVSRIAVSFLADGNWKTSSFHDISVDPFGNHHNEISGFELKKDQTVFQDLGNSLDDDEEQRLIAKECNGDDNASANGEIPEEKDMLANNVFYDDITKSSPNRRRQYTSPLANEILPDSSSLSSNPSVRNLDEISTTGIENSPTILQESEKMQDFTTAETVVHQVNDDSHLNSNEDGNDAAPELFKVQTVLEKSNVLRLESSSDQFAITTVQEIVRPSIVLNLESDQFSIENVQEIEHNLSSAIPHHNLENHSPILIVENTIRVGEMEISPESIKPEPIMDCGESDFAIQTVEEVSVVVSLAKIIIDSSESSFPAYSVPNEQTDIDYDSSKNSEQICSLNDLIIETVSEVEMNEFHYSVNELTNSAEATIEEEIRKIENTETEFNVQKVCEVIPVLVEIQEFSSSETIDSSARLASTEMDSDLGTTDVINADCSPITPIESKENSSLHLEDKTSDPIGANF